MICNRVRPHKVINNENTDCLMQKGGGVNELSTIIANYTRHDERNIVTMKPYII